MIANLMAALVTGSAVALLSLILVPAGAGRGTVNVRGRKAWMALLPRLPVLILVMFILLTLFSRGDGSEDMLPAASPVWLAALLLIAVIDIEQKRILPAVLLPTCLFALLPAALEGTAVTTLAGGLAGLCLASCMYLGGLIYRHDMQRRRGINLSETPFGGGDVLLAGLCGLLCGWPRILAALLLAIFSAGLWALALLALKRASLRSTLPYAPFLLTGTVLTLRFPQAVASLLPLSG